MLTVEERAALIAQLRALPAQLEATVQGWTEEQLDYRPAPSEWSARQIVHHLADSHMNGFNRIKLALTEDVPTIKPYQQERFAELVDSTTLPLEVSFSILRGVHVRWALIWESMSEAQYARSLFDPKHNSHTTLIEQLAKYSNHGPNHINQINANRIAGGW
jgi:DinB superfamily